MGNACSAKAKHQSAVVKQLFDRFADDDGLMTIKGLVQLSKELNRVEMESEVAANYVRKYSSGSEGHSNLTFDDFFAMLLHAKIPAFDAEEEAVINTQEDLSHPLTHYFINSSHNTYLKGAQFASLGGEVSVDMYAQLIREGCRCVELDCYSAEEAPFDPVVYHLTEALTGGKLLVKDIMKVIADALPKGHLPFIINVENHMNEANLARFIATVKHTFGRALVSSFSDWRGRSTSDLPPPQALIDKVILRLKTKGNPSLERITAMQNFKLKKPGEDGQLAHHSVSLSAPKLKKLVKLTAHEAAAKGPGLAAAATEADSDDSSDASTDDGMLDLDDCIGALRYTTRHVTRAYPSNTSVWSENFDPMRGWELGCQIAALNLQTPGLGRDLNAAMFRRNRGTGYVLKPPWMRLRAHDPAPSPPKLETRTRMTIICAVPTKDYKASRFQEKLLDLYVRATVHEPFAPTGRGHRHRTPWIRNDNSPIWDADLTLASEFPEMAFVRLELRDLDQASTDDDIASLACWMPAMKPGIRVFKLMGTENVHVYTVLAVVHPAEVAVDHKV